MPASHVDTSSDPKSHQIIQDSMDPIRSCVNGEIFDSKSKYYAHLRAHGKIVVGNEYNAATHGPKIDEIRERRESKREVAEILKEVKARYGR